MKKKLRSYQDTVLKNLQDPEIAYHYLNDALTDEDPRMFLLALKNVHEAQGGQMTELAKKTNLSRENLYRILSKTGNPKLSSIVSLVDALGFSLAVRPHTKS